MKNKQQAAEVITEAFNGGVKFALGALTKFAQANPDAVMGECCKSVCAYITQGAERCEREFRFQAKL